MLISDPKPSKSLSCSLLTEFRNKKAQNGSRTSVASNDIGRRKSLQDFLRLSENAGDQRSFKRENLLEDDHE